MLTMSSDKLKELICDASVTAVKQKYKRLYQKFYNEDGKLVKGNAEDVKLQLEDEMLSLMFLGHYCETNEGDLEWLKQHPYVYVTGTDLWKSYSATLGYPSMTKAKYLSLLPHFTVKPSYVKDGKTIYAPIYQINSMDYFEPCME